MNKYYGLKKDFYPVKQQSRRIIVSYGLEDIDEIHATWYELDYPTKLNSDLNTNQIKQDIIIDINAHTDEKILSGFKWRNISVYLSSENQFNFKAAYDLAVQTEGASLPIKFKLGETEEHEPMYYTFETMSDFTDFYTKAIAYINKCLNDGWALKDSIDWSQYEI